MKKFADSEDKYCFIAPNGDVYTYIREQGNALVGNINSDELNSLIKKIEDKRVPLRHIVPLISQVALSPYNSD